MNGMRMETAAVAKSSVRLDEIQKYSLLALPSFRALATFPSAFLLACLASCIGSTGGELVEFRAEAYGSASSRAFTSIAQDARYEVQLTQASFTVQGLYFSRIARSGSTERETSCYAAEGYSAELRSDLTIDVLSERAQPFPELARGLNERVRAFDLWLGRGPINEFTSESAATGVVSFAGVAASAGGSFPFEGRVTVDLNRKQTPASPAAPGSNPICQQRIVDGIAADFVPSSGGTLELRLDARQWFDGISFADVPKDARGIHVFVDSADNATSVRLFNNVRKNRGVYSATFRR
jgi:hypothetical protein